MKICIFHKSMGALIQRAVVAAFPDVEVSVVHDTAHDPPGCEQAEVLLANVFPPGLLGRCPKLRWVHLTSSGADQLAGESPRGDLLITTSAEVPARAVAEFVWMGILALAKEAPRLVDQQRAHLWRLPGSRLVAGTRLLLVGLGHIGTEIARRAAGFDVRVTAITRRALPSPLAEEVLPPERLREAARRADHLVLAVPATDGTHHLVDDTVLRALPEMATVINVARASVLDTGALVAALQEHRLRGALLDVHPQEPLPPDSPLWEVDGLWVTPHGAYRFPEEEAEIARIFVENLRRFRNGAL
jgi:phosphoglycerate dehydrogenase-like enzyme